MRFSALALTCALMPSVAFSAEPAQPQACQAHVGQQVATQTFDAVAAMMAKVPAFKGEYETTEAFNARQAAATTGWPATFIIGYQPNRDFLKYDADRGTMVVPAYFFRNRNTSYHDVFGAWGSPFNGKVKFGYFDNIDVVVGETERTKGSYRGSNAFGAGTTVTQIQRSTKAIWEREAKSGEDAFPDQQDGVEAALGSIPISVQQAQALKTGATAALVIAPRWPYFAQGTRVWNATFRDPRQIDNDISVIAADIQCALLLDPAKKVVAAYAVR